MKKLVVFLVLVLFNLNAISVWAQSQTIKTKGRVIDISSQVEAMINANYHRVTRNGHGMEASAYRQLWGQTVVQPPEYVGRFDKVLLVDRTINPIWLIQLANPYLMNWNGSPFSHLFQFVEGHLYRNCTTCNKYPCREGRDGDFCYEFKDVIDSPVDSSGRPLERYIIFIQAGNKNFGVSVKDVQKSFATDEVSLVTIEGLHLPAQLPLQPILNDSGKLFIPHIILAGSLVNNTGIPIIAWNDSKLIYFYSNWHEQQHSTNFFIASRGIKVIPITVSKKFSLYK